MNREARRRGRRAARLAAGMAAAGAGLAALNPDAAHGLPAGWPEYGALAAAFARINWIAPLTGTAAVLAGFAVGTAVGTGDENEARRARRLAGGGFLILGVLLTAAGLDTPLYGVGAATLALSAGLAGAAGEADLARRRRTVRAVGAAAVIAPLLLLANDAGRLSREAREYDLGPGHTAWESEAWRRHPPWAAQAQGDAATDDWRTWAEHRRELLAERLTTQVLTGAGPLAAAGLLFGLLAAGDGRTLTTSGGFVGACAAGAVASTVSGATDWTGIAPRIIETTSQAASLAFAAALLNTSASAQAVRTASANGAAFAWWRSASILWPGAEGRAACRDRAEIAATAAALAMAETAIKHGDIPAFRSVLARKTAEPDSTGLAGLLAAVAAAAAAIIVISHISPTPIGAGHAFTPTTDWVGTLRTAGAPAAALAAAWAAWRIVERRPTRGDGA